MWHEARKMEKALYHQINVTAKRKEQTRRFHELNARDPAELLVIYGTKKKIHNDPIVAQGASEANTMTKWQGDDTIIIDRFDARNLIEMIPKKSTAAIVASKISSENLDDFIENMQLEYERYKELVAVDFTGDSEERVLKNIVEKEQKANLVKLQKLENRKKRKAPVTNKKATIGFTYENDNDNEEDDETTTEASSSTSNKKNFQKPAEGSESESSDEGGGGAGAGIDDELFSAKIGSIIFSSNDWDRLNKLAEKFNIPKEAFAKLYEVDRGFELDNAKINEIEREKLTISGKSGKRDRARLRKTKALILKDPLNEDALACLKKFAEKRIMEAGENISEESSSDGGGEEVEEKTVFITSFGGDEDEEATATVAAAKKKKNKAKAEEINLFDGRGKKEENNEDLKKLAFLKTRRSNSPFGGDELGPSSSSYSSSRRSPNPQSSRNKKSPSPVFRSNRKRKTSRSRSRSKSKSPKPKSKSAASSSGGWLRSKLQNLKKPESSEKSPPFGRRSRSRSSISSISSENEVDGDNKNEEPLEIRSSMSESEKEKIEIENRKRRIRKTKKDVKKRRKMDKTKSDTDEDSEAERKSLAAKKLKIQLHETLNKTAKELQAEQMEKKLQQEEDKERRYDEEYIKNRYIARHTPNRSISSSSSSSSSPGHERERKRSYDERNRDRKKKNLHRDSRRRRSRSSRSRSRSRSQPSRQHRSSNNRDYHRNSNSRRRSRSSRSRSRSPPRKRY